MPNYSWEDPFGIKGREETTPALWVPDQRVPPADVRAIRREQKTLLPYIHELRKAAVHSLRRVAADARLGGPVLLRQSERDLAVSFLFRSREHPDILRSFGPIPITDHPVVLPAATKSRASVLDHLFPTHRITEGDQRKAIIDAQKELGLIERLGIAEKPVTPDRIVVFANLLHFAAHWIGHYRNGTIFDLKYKEVPKERSLQGKSHHVIDFSNPRSSSPPLQLQ